MMGNLTEAVGLFDSEPHTDPTDPTGFSLWVGNLTETCGFLCEGKSHGFL